MKREEVVNEIKELILEKESRLEKGDSSKDKSIYDKLVNLYSDYIKQGNDFSYILDKLISSEFPAVSSTASAYALSIGYNIGAAEENLKRISEMNDIGLTSFNAKMTLKTWKEQGYLRF